MRYVVIGGNAAGMSFAAKMRRNQPESEIIVIERRDYVSFGSCGLPYFVADYFTSENTMIARTPKEFAKSDIDLRINEEVINVEPTEKQITIKKDDETYNLSYDTLIVSSGASPKVPDFGTYDKSKVTALFDLNDGRKLKELCADYKHITIIGAGFIGLEVMDVAHDLQKEVTVVEYAPNILAAPLSSELSEKIEQEIIDKKIDLRLNTGVEKIEDYKDGYKVHTSKGIIETDVVVIAIGFSPNTDFIDVEKSRGAIVVDKNCKTSIDDIYAIGDCALTYNYILDDFVYLPLATNSNKLGRSLADRLSDKKVSFKGMLGSGCLKVLDYEVGFTGVNESLAKSKGLKVKSNIIKTKNQTGYYPGQEDIHIKLTYLEENNVIIGGEIIGKKGAVLRVDALAVAILNQMTTDELGYVDFCYSPPFAPTWDPLNVAGNAAK